jgi:site-specific recombinase XerD
MKHNAANERIKRDYFHYLAEARGRDEATIDSVAKSLARFEGSTGARDFKRFHREQAVAFKRAMREAVSARTGERLSKATMLSTLRDLRAFFFWLAHLPGFKSHIAYADADYFNLSDKEVAVARAAREKSVPTLSQVERVLSVITAGTVLKRRDRALIALTMITGARADALATFRLEHVDLAGGYVEQDARTVRTKFAKTFRTYFMPVSEAASAIVEGWIEERRGEHLAGPTDLLFPATAMGLDVAGNFAPSGLAPHGWATTEPIRSIFRAAFTAAGLPYYNPHSFRHMLMRHAMALHLTPEQLKAWSQNLGHEDVLTTFTSYGQVPTHRQGELIRHMPASPEVGGLDNRALMAALATRLEQTS